MRVFEMHSHSQWMEVADYSAAPIVAAIVAVVPIAAVAIAQQIFAHFVY